MFLFVFWCFVTLSICVGRMLKENPHVAMDTVAHLVHTMSGTQRAEVARLFSTIESTESSSSSAESVSHA